LKFLFLAASGGSIFSHHALRELNPIKMLDIVRYSDLTEHLAKVVTAASDPTKKYMTTQSA
jgi:hypothetical protein